MQLCVINITTHSILVFVELVPATKEEKEILESAFWGARRSSSKAFGVRFGCLLKHGSVTVRTAPLISLQPTSSCGRGRVTHLPPPLAICPSSACTAALTNLAKSNLQGFPPFGKRALQTKDMRRKPPIVADKRAKNPRGMWQLAGGGRSGWTWARPD